MIGQRPRKPLLKIRKLPEVGEAERPNSLALQFSCRDSSFEPGAGLLISAVTRELTSETIGCGQNSCETTSHQTTDLQS